MFDKLMHDLKHLERGVQIKVTLPSDGEGYFDRKCGACQAEFKVLEADWESKVSDDKMYCPICRHEDAKDAWNTALQTKYVEEVALAHVTRVVTDGLKQAARQFNSQQRGGFVQMSMSVKSDSETIILPVEAANTFRQKYVCEACGCRHSVIGTAFFCPACGHDSAMATFDQTVETVRRMMTLIPSIRTTVTVEFDQDTAENSIRHILEESLGRLVGAFQRFMEVLFNRLPGAATIKQRKKVFQNLTESSALWKTAASKGYEDLLTSTELRELEQLFQKRHLIAHRNGVVDQEYIDKTGDTTYLIGQRLVIREPEIMRLSELVSKLASELRLIV